MQSEAITSAANIDQCTRCGSLRPGLGWRFGYGLPSRGTNPRTLVTDDGYLGSDAVFLCNSCQRYLLWFEFRRFFSTHGLYATMALVPFLTSLLFYGWKRGRVVDDKEILALVGIVIGCVFVGLRWLRRDAATMQRLCFEFRRKEIAAKLALPASRLTQYPPR